jgi:hypothetical protein
MKITNLKRAAIALVLCTAGEVGTGPAAVIATGAGILVTGKVAQGVLDQTDASTKSNNNGVNALNNNIQGGISGSKSEQVKGGQQAPGM